MKPAIKIIIQNRQRKYPIDKRQIHDWVSKILQILDENTGEVGVTFVNNRVIQELNRQYRGKDTPTDVLSFPMLENPKEHEKTFRIEEETPTRLLGDVIISLEKAHEEAPLFYKGFSEQVLFLIIHGLLHLLGYDHEQSRNEAARMRRQEERLFNRIWVRRPSGPATLTLNAP